MTTTTIDLRPKVKQYEAYGHTGTSQCWSTLRFKVEGRKEHGLLTTDGMKVTAISPRDVYTEVKTFEVVDADCKIMTKTISIGDTVLCYSCERCRIERRPRDQKTFTGTVVDINGSIATIRNIRSGHNVYYNLCCLEKIN